MTAELEAQFSEHEDGLRDTADVDLGALAVFRAATGALAGAVDGATIPQASEPAPPDWYVRAALLNLSVMAHRTARAFLAVITTGYEPEAQGLKRRLSEIYARVAAVIDDTSGQHAREWLEGKPPSTPRKLAGKYASVDLFDMYSQMDHADPRGTLAWLAVPMPEVDPYHRGLIVTPHRRPGFANALLVEAANELRDLANIMAKSQGRTIADRDRLDSDIRAARECWYTTPERAEETDDGRE